MIFVKRSIAILSLLIAVFALPQPAIASHDDVLRLHLPVNLYGSQKLKVDHLIRQYHAIDLNYYALDALIIETTGYGTGYVYLTVDGVRSPTFTLDGGAQVIAAPTLSPGKWRMRLGGNAEVVSITAVLVPRTMIAYHTERYDYSVFGYYYEPYRHYVYQSGHPWFHHYDRYRHVPRHFTPPYRYHGRDHRRDDHRDHRRDDYRDHRRDDHRDHRRDDHRSRDHADRRDHRRDNRAHERHEERRNAGRDDRREHRGDHRSEPRREPRREPIAAAPRQRHDGQGRRLVTPEEAKRQAPVMAESARRRMEQPQREHRANPPPAQREPRHEARRGNDERVARADRGRDTAKEEQRGRRFEAPERRREWRERAVQ